MATLYNALGTAVLVFLASPFASAQQAANCELANSPATSAFDFTEAISRWGSSESYELDGHDYRVGEIHINGLPIFDESNPKEDKALFRWLNGFHIDTRDDVLRNQLLFATGEGIDSQKLSENERLLRQRKYVGESKIRVLQKCEDAVDLEVVTREVWTLVPGFSFHASGGDNDFSLGLREANLLGTGQRVSAFYKSDADRDSYQLSFENPNIGNTYRVLKLQADDNSDGNHYLAEYSLPFYSLDSRNAWYAGYESTEETLTQYRYGEKLSELLHETETAEISRGFSDGLVAGKAQRLSYGIRYEKQTYKPGIELIPPTSIGKDLSIAYPFLQLERVEDNFAVGYNISQIYRAEDLMIGSRLSASVGYAAGDEDRIVAAGEFSDTLLSRPKLLLQWQTDWYGRWNRRNGSWEDAVVNLNIDYHRGQTENRTLYMGFAATRSLNLNNGRQVTLGGSTGLRGFESHYLNGDSSVRFTVEERIFSNYHVLQLLRLGFAAFMDAGRVFGAEEDGAGRTFSNIGIGMRLAPSKSDKGKIIHIDLAYPLQSAIPGGRSVQLVLEAKTSF